MAEAVAAGHDELAHGREKRRVEELGPRVAVRDGVVGERLRAGRVAPHPQVGAGETGQPAAHLPADVGARGGQVRPLEACVVDLVRQAYLRRADDAPAWERERRALRPLPAELFDPAEVRLVTLRHHASLMVRGASYSVPSRWCGGEMEVRVGTETVVFARGKDDEVMCRHADRHRVPRKVSAAERTYRTKIKAIQLSKEAPCHGGWNSTWPNLVRT